MRDDDDDDSNPYDARNERVGPTSYAFCRVCKWQTGNYPTYHEPLQRARRHADKQRHTTEVHTTAGVVLRSRGGLT